MSINYRGYDIEQLDKMTEEMEKVLESKGVTEREYVRFAALTALGSFYIKAEEDMTDEDALDMLFLMLESTDEEWEEE
ncbi:hypothetical protein Q3C81_08105 [Enterococcus faecium]|nr:hypothetical protein [Enterococcus faecium]